MQNKPIYEFGSFRLDAAQHILLSGGQIVPLTPKAFETLQVLVENNGQVVEKDELLQKIWSDTIVEEASLAKNISVLRKILKENCSSGNSYIETIPKRGYRFTAPVSEVKNTFSEESPAVIAAGENKKTDAPVSMPKRKIDLITVAIILLASFAAFAGYRWSVAAGNGGGASGNPATGSAAIPRDRTIAVLPFKPLTDNEEDKTLGLGMADALIIKLGQLDQVNIRPTSNIRQFTDQPAVDAMAAGRTLKVEAVLEGTIQRFGDRLRITAQLINVSDGRQLWADKFEEKMNDFFVVQDAIAVRVANSLVPQLTEVERQKLSRRETNNPEAYRLYVLGGVWIDHETTEGFNKGIEYLHRAIELDPNFAIGHSALSHAYSDASESHLPPGEAMPKAKFYAERALQLDETLSWAHYQLGWVKMLYDWDWAGAEMSFKRALELDPNYARAYFGYGTYLALQGRREEALAELERAKSLRPLNIIGSNILYRTGEYDRALAEANKALEMNPKRISSLQWAAMSYERKAMYQEAIGAFEKARQIEDTAELKAFQAHTYAVSGNTNEAVSTIAELKQLSAQNRYVSPFYIAVVYAGLGDKEQALAWLEKAYRDRSWWIATLKTNPQLESLRDTPRFRELLRRANF